MANNHVSSLLNVDLPKPKRSNFNLGRVNRFTADPGWVIPCYVEEILPNSYKRLDVTALIQTNATIAPLLGSYRAKIDAFFVPLRLYHRHLDLNNIAANFSDDFDYHFINTPSIRNIQVVNITQTGSLNQLPNSTGNRTLASSTWALPNEDNTNTFLQDRVPIQVAPCSLLDYLGVMPVGFSDQQWSNSRKLNGTPFIAYYDIWRNFYSNPHDKNVPMRISNFSSNVAMFGEEANQPILDRYVSLDKFDDFISYINQSSMSISGQPTPVDVISAFFTNIYPDPVIFQQVGSGSNPTTNTYIEPSAFTLIPLYAGQLTSSSIFEDITKKFYAADTHDGKHFGLLRRTYMDDYFTARFTNEFVNYMEDTAVVTVENNQFSIQQLRLQNRIAKFIDKSIFADTRFGSWIKAHYGVSTNAKLNIPQFLGSISTNIEFNDIYSTAQTGDSSSVTSNKALGSRASLGQGYLKNKGSFIEFKASEPGYLMCMFSIIPQVSYFQGIKKMYLKTSFNDMYRPEFDAVGYDDLQKLEMTAVPNPISIYHNNTDIVAKDINAFNTSMGKHPAWMEYMTSVDESHGLMTQRYENGYWLLNRPFSPRTYEGGYVYNSNEDMSLAGGKYADVLDVSTYICPEYFNTVFAVDRFTDNFQVQLRFFDKTKQPISKQILPHL